MNGYDTHLLPRDAEQGSSTLAAEDVLDWLDDSYIDPFNHGAAWTDLQVDFSASKSGHQPTSFQLDVPQPVSVSVEAQQSSSSNAKLSSASNSSSSTNVDVVLPTDFDQVSSKRKVVTRKRRRENPVQARRMTHVLPSPVVGDAEALQAINGLRSLLPRDHMLGYDRNTVDPRLCTRQNCYLLTPLDAEPRSYFGSRLPTGQFSVRLLDPSNSRDADHITAWRPGRSTLFRPAGRSIHLVVTSLPNVQDKTNLDTGFALIFGCRTDDDHSDDKPSWIADCLVTFFNASNGKGRSRVGPDANFRGNMEHCVDEASGRRLWGLRTSHVKRTIGENQKAIRILPRSNLGASSEVQVCFMVALFSAKGDLLQHRDGTPCVAQSNAVTFQPVKNEKLTESVAGLLREITKLSFEERVDITTFTTLGQTIRTVLTSPDAASRARVGQIDFPTDTRPSTACYLTDFLGPDLRLPNLNDEHLTHDYKIRVRSVARAVGWYGADVELTDPARRHLHTLSAHGAAGRYGQIKEAGLEEAMRWLDELGVKDLTIADVYARFEMAGTVMKERRFCSPWTVTLTNVYPERILVDRVDTEKVYCLADTIFEADIAIRDRLLPLARLAFCSKLARRDLKEYILEPYVEGFLKRNQDVKIDMDARIMSERYTLNRPFSTSLLDETKFHLILHGMHLDYFLYWIRFRNPISVKRLARKILEDEENWDPWFFESGRFVPLKTR